MQFVTGDGKYSERQERVTTGIISSVLMMPSIRPRADHAFYVALSFGGNNRTYSVI